jgi:hypothetical protein
MRIDLYGLVHKVQRYHLFAFAQQLAWADLGNATSRAHLESAVRRLGELLRDHAENERHYIHPLFEAFGAAAEVLEADHLELDGDIAGWVALIDQQRWDELYPASMRLIGKYLLHIDAEERAQAESLWPHYTDAQLEDVMRRFKAERSPRAARSDLELSITGLGNADLAKFLRGFSSAPPAVRQDVFDRAQQLLTPERWAAIVAGLP